LSIPTYDDHRLAMAFSIASSLFKYSKIRIINKNTVAKTFPEFWTHLEKSYGFKTFY